MDILRVEMIYTSQEPDHIKPLIYYMMKRFKFPQVPSIECGIRLSNDAIEMIDFKKPIFEYNVALGSIWSITNSTSEGVERYYSGDRYKIMRKVIERYKHYGWAIEPVK